MKNCSVFASLISPSKLILFEKKYQTFDTLFHHQMKHLEVRQKYSAVRRIFNSLLGVSSGDETLRLMFDILLQNQLRCRYRISSNNSRGRLFLFLHKKGDDYSIIQILLTGSHALNICFIFPLNQKIITSCQIN